MKYLVNRETKEHLIYDGGPHPSAWKIVEADDEGWIKWTCNKNTECPLPAKAKVDLKWIEGADNFGVIAGAGWNWEGTCNNGVAFYRPILPAESKPDSGIPASGTIGAQLYDVAFADNPLDVFTRLKSAVTASESIPALIAEINAMLPDGYEVTRK